MYIIAVEVAIGNIISYSIMLGRLNQNHIQLYNENLYYIKILKYTCLIMIVALLGLLYAGKTNDAWYSTERWLLVLIVGLMILRYHENQYIKNLVNYSVNFDVCDRILDSYEQNLNYINCITHRVKYFNYYKYDNPVYYDIIKYLELSTLRKFNRTIAHKVITINYDNLPINKYIDTNNNFTIFYETGRIVVCHDNLFYDRRIINSDVFTIYEINNYVFYEINGEKYINFIPYDKFPFKISYDVTIKDNKLIINNVDTNIPVAID